MVFLKKTGAYFEILRPLNCAMAAFAALLGYWLSQGYLALPFEAVLAAASTFVICGAGQAINDYYDFKTDAKGKPARPIPSNRILPEDARNYAVSLFLLGISLAYAINARAFGIALAFSVLLYAYSSKAAKRKYLANAIVALGTAFTFIMGASLTGNYVIAALLGTASFFATWGREIAKDPEDVSQDRNHKKTLPMVWGDEGARKVAQAATIVAVFFGLVPVLLGFSKPVMLLLLGIGIGEFLIAISQMRKKGYKNAQESYKYAMLLMLAAYAASLL